MENKVSGMHDTLFFIDLEGSPRVGSKRALWQTRCGHVVSGHGIIAAFHSASSNTEPPPFPKWKTLCSNAWLKAFDMLNYVVVTLAYADLN